MYILCCQVTLLSGNKNIYIPFDEKIKHLQAKVRERRNFKNSARFIRTCINSENNDNRLNSDSFCTMPVVIY